MVKCKTDTYVLCCTVVMDLFIAFATDTAVSSQDPSNINVMTMCLSDAVLVQERFSPLSS